MGSLQKCRFAKVCKFYSATSFPCNAEDEAEDYCGTFGIFANFTKSKPAELLERNNEL
jgi:hypothetical protein